MAQRNQRGRLAEVPRAPCVEMLQLLTPESRASEEKIRDTSYLLFVAARRSPHPFFDPQGPAFLHA